MELPLWAKLTKRQLPGLIAALKEVRETTLKEAHETTRGTEFNSGSEHDDMKSDQEHLISRLKKFLPNLSISRKSMAVVN